MSEKEIENDKQQALDKEEFITTIRLYKKKKMSRSGKWVS